MAKRISIKGKGADLFFSGESDSPTSPTSPLPPPETTKEQDVKTSSSEDLKISSIEEMKKTNKRELYKKVNYRLCPEAIESIEDTKLILQRKYHIKATYEDIAEAIIIHAYQDLLDNGEASSLVRALSSHEEMKK